MRVRLALIAFTALHLALVQHFFPLQAVLDEAPLQGDDYDLHAGQVLRVVEGLERWGRSWVYDVELVAGQPEGTISDAGSKGWELWTFAVKRLGASHAQAFDSFVLLAMVICPLVVWLAARVFRLDAWTALLAAALASCLWFFDSFLHWLWWVGMVSYAFASHLALLPLAFFYRYLEQRAARWALLCAPMLGLALLVHPYTFFTLLLPMVALYARAFRTLRPVEHAGVASIGLCALAINAFWLHNAFSHWQYVLDSAFYAQAGAHYALADFFQVLLSAADTGVIGVRTGFRLLTVALGLAGLWVWRQKAHPLLLPLGFSVSALLVIAYLGAYVPGATQIQPYRHIVPAMIFATLPAAAFLRWLVTERVIASLQLGARIALAIALLLVAQHLATQVHYFFPRALPETALFPDGSPSPISKYGHFNVYPEHSHVQYRLPHEPWLEVGADELVTWVQENLPPGTRVLVDHGIVGERLAWKTHVEVLGGFFERNTQHAYANFFRRFEHRRASPSELARYLRTFAVELVITHRPRADIDNARHLLEALPPVENRKLYRPTFPVSRVLAGGGRVRASTNLIQVTDSDPAADLVLSYHFHPALRCEPHCRVRREAIDFDPVGLIRVPAPHPANLRIVNRY